MNKMLQEDCCVSTDMNICMKISIQNMIFIVSKLWFIYLYMLAISGQTVEPNGRKLVERTFGTKG